MERVNGSTDEGRVLWLVVGGAIEGHGDLLRECKFYLALESGCLEDEMNLLFPSLIFASNVPCSLVFFGCRIESVISRYYALTSSIDYALITLAIYESPPLKPFSSSSRPVENVGAAEPSDATTLENSEWQLFSTHRYV